MFPITPAARPASGQPLLQNTAFAVWRLRRTYTGWAPSRSPKAAEGEERNDPPNQMVPTLAMSGQVSLHPPPEMVVMPVVFFCFSPIPYHRHQEHILVIATLVLIGHEIEMVVKAHR
jgi:hypothetical protein